MTKVTIKFRIRCLDGQLRSYFWDRPSHLHAYSDTAIPPGWLFVYHNTLYLKRFKPADPDQHEEGLMWNVAQLTFLCEPALHGMIKRRFVADGYPAYHSFPLRAPLSDG